MRKLLNRLTAAILVFTLFSGFGGALAAPTDDPDITGHWAESTLRRALDDALIDGAGDGLNPDEPVSGAEIVHILCRILSTGRTADISGIAGFNEADPYYTAVSQAAALGLFDPDNMLFDINKPVTRGEAFVLLAEALQLVAAQQDTSVLSRFSDGEMLGARYRRAAAALVSGGFVQGINGALNISGIISRAEFLTVLYKLLPNYAQDEQNPDIAAGGAVYSGTSPVSNRQFSGAVFFDCSSSNIQLYNTEASSVVLRSDNLSALSVISCNIDRLIFAAGGGDIRFDPGPIADIETAVVGTGSGKMTFGAMPNIEITGSGREIILTGSVQSLLVSGSGNRITVAPGVMVNALKILGEGSGNTVTVNGYVNDCIIYGPGNILDGTGTVQVLRDNAKNSAVTAKAVERIVNEAYGLNSVALALTAPDNLPAFETLKASVSVYTPAGSKPCRYAWYINGKLVSQSDVDIGKTTSVSLDSDIKNNGDAPVTVALSFVLSFSDDDGNYQEIRTDRNVTLLNETKFDAAEVLALVKTAYQGDYTLAWAKSNDYENGVKTAWVNAKGYTSKTSYLVWVNIAYQRVNIFTGSAGNWELDRSFIVGTGASGSDTPTGVFKIIGRNTKGWTTKAYTVKPLIFFMNYAYAFHSRLYSPGTTTVNDARIGFPISHGCVRMYDEDVAWVYDNIPTNTTVVVY
jgi:hypothetical protein